LSAADLNIKKSEFIGRFAKKLSKLMVTVELTIAVPYSNVSSATNLNTKQQTASTYFQQIGWTNANVQ